MKTDALLLFLILAVGHLHSAASLRGTFSNNPDRKLQSDPAQDDLCASVIAIALTPDPSSKDSHQQQRILQVVAPKAGKVARRPTTPPTTSPTPKSTIDESVSSKDLGEEFVCERATTGELLPLIGNEEQMAQLRESLNNGDLVSAETTIAGLTEENIGSVDVPGVEDGNSNPLIEGGNGSNSTAVMEIVSLPIGEFKLKPGNGQHSLRKRFLAESESRKAPNRRLAVYEGVKKILFVRVIDVDGLVHPDNAETMSDKIFGTYGDTTTMKDQFEACSFGKLKITNNYGFSLGNAESAPGVIEVKINVSLKTSDKATIQTASKKAAEAKIGMSLPGAFDHVMYSLAGCYIGCGWAAYGGVNSWFTYYQGNNYRYPAVAMHEIGHNLNLAHSGGNDGKEYSDHSCLMGNPWFRDDVSQMCFNPAKSFQISSSGSWYDDRIMTWNSGNSNPTRLVQSIIGIADYGNNPGKLPVVVKLETGTADDIFVGFNRARGVNSASKEANDEVTVIQQGNNGQGYSKSVLLTSLSSGGSYTMTNWQGSGKNMVVTVNSIQTANPWSAEVEFNFNNAQGPPPPPLPTPQPSPRPSPKPTPFPTGTPISTSPTKSCGDSICMADETDKSCPADCVNAEFATYTDNIGAKGSNGTMFAIQAVRDVEINAIWTFVRSNSVDLVQVYTRQGKYNGLEGSDAGWDLVFDQSILLNGRDQLTELVLRNKVFMPSGQFQSFYVYSPSNLAYREEQVREGDLIKSDQSFRYFAGIAIAYGKFGQGQIFSPRVFSGILSYDALAPRSTTSSPSSKPTLPPPTMIPTPKPTTQCGNGICDFSEHSTNCAIDCRNVEYNAVESGSKGAEGTMFFVKALRDIIVTSFDVYGVSTNTSLFQVYTRVDSWEGHEASQDGWTLIYDNPSLQQKGRYTLTSLGDFSNGVLIPAGAILSFYLFTPTKLIYDVGSGLSPYSQNNALEFYEGIGVIGGLFAGGDSIQNTISPRVFSGIIRYDVIKSVTFTLSPTPKPSAIPTNMLTLKPTNQPVGVCGNNICEFSENASSCPSDCKKLFLRAADAGAKGAEGAMFYVKPLRNILLRSFDFFGSTEATSVVQVYTRPGTYRGFESSTDGWKLVYNASIFQMGRNNSTSMGDFDSGVFIPANTQQSFLIYSPNKVMYREGSSEGSLYSSDSALEFYEGIGLVGFFSGNPNDVFSPRVFRGGIRYDVLGDTCGNSICEVHETAVGCPSDCENLFLETSDAASKGAQGAMFYVKTLRAINITSLDFYGSSVNTNLVQVYTRRGKYIGYELQKEGWELVYDNGSVNIKGRFDATSLGSFSKQVSIPANTFQSFYIYSPSKVMYKGGTNETSEGSLYSSNDAIEFFEGIGVEGFFPGVPTSIYRPRIWRGTIRFDGA